MKKRLNLIYFSATDTTAKVVQEVAKSISNEFKEYNITSQKNRQDELCFNRNDLVIVGVPVYAGRVPEFLVRYFQKVQGNHTPAVFIVVYGNRDYDDALLELKDLFEANGFIGIAGGAFIGEHSDTDKVATGRPDTKDLQIAKAFGIQIKEKIQKSSDHLTENQLIVKGNFPYKERGVSPLMAPETSEECIQCGLCAEHCPVSAISPEQPKDADPKKCIRCCSCIKRCPVKAKAMNHEAFDKITKMLLTHCTSYRNEPDLFI